MQPYKDLGSGEVGHHTSCTDDYPTYYVLDSGQMKMSKRWSQPSRHSPSDQRSLWWCDLIICGAGFGGFRWETSHCWCEWGHCVIQENFFLQNMALVVMVMSLLHNARDKEITHSHGRQKKPSLLFKYWRETVGHGVILFIESYKWQLNEKWNQTLTSTKMWMVNPALSENVLQFGRDWAWARANTENQPENPEKTKCIPVDLPTGISLCNSPPPFPKGAIPGPWGWGRDGESWGRQAH